MFIIPFDMRYWIAFVKSESCTSPCDHIFAVVLTHFGIEMLLFMFLNASESALIMFVLDNLSEKPTISGLPSIVTIDDECSSIKIPDSISYTMVDVLFSLEWNATSAVLLKPLKSVTSCVTEVSVLL